MYPPLPSQPGFNGFPSEYGQYLGMAPALPAPPPVPPGVSSAPSFFALVRAFQRRWLLASVVGLLVAGLAAAGVWFFLPAAKHSASAILYVPLRPLSILYDHPESRIDPAVFQANQANWVKDRSVLNAALDDKEVKKLPLVQEQDEPVEWLVRNIRSDYPNGPEFLYVTLTGDDTRELKVLVDAIVEAYLRDVVNAQTLQRQDRLKELEDLMLKYETKLKDRRDIMRKKARQAGGTTPEAHALHQKFAAEQFHAASNDLNEIKNALRKLELLRGKAQDELNGNAEVTQEAITEEVEKSPTIVGLKGRGKQLDDDLSGALGTLRDPENHPTVLRLRSLIKENNTNLEATRKKLRPNIEKEMRETLQQNAQTSLARTKNQIDALQKMEAEMFKRVDKLHQEGNLMKDSAVDIDEYKLEIAQVEAVATRAATDLEQLRVELTTPPRVKKHQSATVARVEDFPRRVRFASLAGFVAFLVAALGVALIEFLRRRVHNPEDLVSGLGMPLLGTVPAAPSRYGRLAGSEAEARWHSMLADSVDAARTLLLRAATQEGLRVVLITSAVSGEGKTSLSSHLAVSLARAGRKTLLIDCDLRSPALHQLFDVPAGPGFCELLRGEVPPAEAIRPAAYPGLAILPAGSCCSRSLALLAQDRLREVLAQLREPYDFVIVDSSPVLPVPDGLLIAGQCDGVLFSVMRDVSQLPRVYAAYQKLAVLGVRMLGAVVNGTRAEGYGYGNRYLLPVPQEAT